MSLRFAWRDLVVLVTTGAKDSEGELRHATEEIRERARRRGDPVAFLHVQSGRGAPDADLRREIEASMRELEPHLRCLTMLIDAEGFLAATLISIGSSMIRTFGRCGPTRMFRTSADAASWLCTYVDGYPDEIREVVDQIRARSLRPASPTPHHARLRPIPIHGL